MEENKFSVNLASMNNIFSNKTLNYRINGFAYACKMEDVSLPSKLATNNGKDDIGYNQVLFGKTDELDYFISVSTSKDKNLGESVTLNGYYNDLIFTFTNYYKLGKMYKLDKKVMELPFKISLTKKVDKDNYVLNIETNNGMETKFNIHKYREYKNHSISSEYTFYSNIEDFSNVLKLVKAFVYNPELLFTTYDEINNRKKVVFTSNDVNKGLMQDNNLDKPVGKIKKIMKTIINR